MTEIPEDGPLASLSMLKAYGYTTAEEVFYLAQALGPELSELVGIAPLPLQMMLAPTIAMIPQAQADELLALPLPMGVPINLAPPTALPFVAAPVPEATPPQVNHIPDMPAIRDQSPRGTCVAHSAVAVVEHALKMGGTPADLSEQFLYWDCKQNDGIPNQGGTWLRVAFPLVRRDGICPEADWPYQKIGCATEGCGPPPGIAIPAALTFRMPEVVISPTSVPDIKAKLASGRCVAFSIPVFRSWYHNVSVRADGKINMPVPNDIVEGGHAMCLVGYSDSAEIGMGGGRFLFRNSWGTAWAPQSPHGAGYGSIPYAYIQRYCSEAYSVT